MSDSTPLKTSEMLRPPVHPPELAHHFEDLEQQHESATLGMWLFLATEVLFFGGLFLGYAVYRWQNPEAWAAASRQLDIPLGALNTAVLLGSSLTMALAVRGGQVGRVRDQVRYLWATLALGSVFLGIKAIEYSHKFHVGLVPGDDFHWPDALAPAAEIFFSFYFTMTGLHALHMVIGMVLMLFILRGARQGRYKPAAYSPLEAMGLYWHFVDIVWIFLFPLLYLLGRDQ